MFVSRKRYDEVVKMYKEAVESNTKLIKETQNVISFVTSINDSVIQSIAIMKELEKRIAKLEEERNAD